MAPEAGAATTWRGIDELAALVGAYCWVENRIFEVSGSWACAPGGGAEQGCDPALRVWCAGVSRRHGLQAGRWAERLPARAGVDAAALVTAPAGPLEGALDALAARPDTGAGVAALALSVLPRVQAVYGAHLRTATPVSEGSVVEVLVGAHRDLAGEISGGRSLLQAAGLGGDAAPGRGLERAFDETRIFPAVHTS